MSHKEPAKTFQGYCDEVAAGNLPAAAALGSFLCSSLVLLLYLAKPSIASGVLENFAVGSLLLAGVSLGCSLRSISPRYAHPLMSVSGILTMGAFLYPLTRGEELLSHGCFQLLLVGGSLLLLRPFWVLSCNSVFLVTWVVLLQTMGTLGSAEIKLIIVSCVLSAACMASRQATLREQWRAECAHLETQTRLRQATLRLHLRRQEIREQRDARSRKLELEESQSRERQEAIRKMVLRAEIATSLDRLAGGLAHEFSNSLTSMRGNLELAVELMPADFCVETRDDLWEAIERATELSSRLRKMSGAAFLKLEPAKISQVLSRIERTVPSSTEIVSNCSEDSIYVDEGAWLQICQNLVCNARDATGPDGRVRLSVTREADEIVFAVDDDGPGLSPEQRKLVIQPFFTTKTPSRGIGLGLAIVSALAQQHGSSLELEDSELGGLCARVAIQSHKEEGTCPSPERKKPAGLALASGETVLLVEDNIQVRQVTEKYLQRLGYKVLLAEDGLAALEVTKENHFDILLSDLVMPRMGGAKLVTKLRVTHPKTPVLVMTGYGEEELSLPEIQSNLPPILRKPFSLSALASRLREALEVETS